MNSRLLRFTTLQVVIMLGFTPVKTQASVYDSGVLNFSYDGHNMWGPTSSFVVSPDQFVGLDAPAPFGLGGFSIGGIKDAGPLGQYGAQVSGVITSAKVGLDIGGSIDSGSIKVNYGADAKLTLPDAPLLKGSYVSFGGANNTTVSSGSLQTQLGTVSLYEDFTYKVPAYIAAKACAYDCVESSANIAGTVNPFELFSLNRNGDGLVKVFGTTQQVNFGNPISLDANFEIDGVAVGTNLGSVTVYSPTLSTAGSVPDAQGNLTSSSSTKLVDASLDISNAFSLLAGQGTKNLNLGIGDAASVYINPVALYAAPSVSLEQKFSFDPNLQVDLHFDHAITASIGSGPLQRSQTSDDFLVSMADMSNYHFRFDSDTHVKPTFVLGNSFQNLSKLDVSLGLNLTELQASLSVAGQNVASFSGITQHLASADIHQFTVFDQAYGLGFKTIAGNAFDIKTLGQSVDGLYALWTGQGYDNNWSTAGNWQNDNKPVSGDALLFYGSPGGRIVSTDNQNAFSINGMTFLQGADAFAVGGNDVNNTGDVLNQSTKLQTINQNLLVAASQDWDGGVGGLKYTGRLAVDNNFSLSLLNTHVESTESILVGNTRTGTLNVTNGSNLQASGLSMGVTDKTSVGKVFVSGSGTRIMLENQLLAGDSGSADLYLEKGAQVNASAAVFANNSSANAFVGLDGFNTRLSISHSATLANSGLLILKMTNGARLDTNDTSLSVNSTSGADMHLSDAGTRWTVSGSLKAGGDGQTRLVMDTSSQLNVGNSLVWGTGAGRAELNINQGSQVAVAGDASIGGKGLVYLAGNSSLNQPLLKVSGRTTEQAGAELMLNGAKAALTGGLDVAGTVQSINTSEIDGNIQLAAGVGQIVTKTGQLTLMGDVLHNGATINTLAGATTVFQGAVSGAGNFSGGGNVDFERSYAPGNSPAAINFGGDNVTFGANSTLSMDIFGANPGKQYDQLLNIGKLDFEGQLKLNFANYSPDVAMIFTLFDYKSFSGSFDSARIFVGGIDKSRLDFSQLALNGELSVRAIPIPPSFIFLASGLAVMLTSNLRRKGLVRIDGPDLLA